MIATFVDAALRSLLLAIAVWAGLRVFRVRNVLAQKAAWAAVLAGALLMPALLLLSVRWHLLPQETLVLPSQFARLQAALKFPEQPAAAHSPVVREPDAVTVPQVPAIADPRNMTLGQTATAQPDPTPTRDFMTRSSNAAPAPARASVPIGVIPGNSDSARSDAPGRHPISFAMFCAGLYLIVAAALLFRLGFGLVSTLRLWRTAKPAKLGGALRRGAELNVRFSGKASSPVTIGSGVLLPANYAEWDDEKLRIVLAHERSHVCQRDFYWQLLAAFYAALVWFSPLGWWLKHKLSDLGETIGDLAGLNEARNRTSYAQILLEFATAPHTSLIGVAMARSSSTSRRIERLLNDRVFRQAFAGGRRAFLVALVAPVALFAFTAFVRVEAQTTAPSQTQAPVTGQSKPDSAPVNVAPDASPIPAPAAAPTPAAAPASSPVHVDVPAIHVNVPAIHVDVPAKSIDIHAVHVDVPAKHIDVPAVRVDVPAKHMDVSGQHVDIPAIHVDVPAQHIDVPAIHVDIPAKQMNVPAVHVNVPAQHIDVPAIHIDLPPPSAQNTSGYRYSYRTGGQLLAMLSPDGSGIGLGRGRGEGRGIAVQTQSDLNFDRTLSINGKLTLSVATGSGNIHLTKGSGSQVVIHGTVRTHEGADEAQAQAIAANPPIEQNGNTIRIGAQHEQNKNNHISIDYDIEAPADAALDAATGSGNVVDEGVGAGAKLQTGSGNITATGLQGGFTTQTGSGNIAVDDAGEGDAKAQTGSGNIAIKGVHGSLKAQTGSGKISAAGTPSAEWKLQTGSGSIELQTGNAPMTLDAGTGSGKISTAQQTETQVSLDKHHLHAQLNGGGPEVKVETGSGDIRID